METAAAPSPILCRTIAREIPISETATSTRGVGGAASGNFDISQFSLSGFLNEGEKLDRYIGDTHLSVSMQLKTLMLFGNALYREHELKCYQRDIELFWSILIEGGRDALNKPLLELRPMLKKSTCRLLDKQIKTSKLRCVGFLNDCVHPQFYKWLKHATVAELNQDVASESPYAGTISLRSSLSSAQNFISEKLPVNKNATLFAASESERLKITNLTHHLWRLNFKGLPSAVKEQAANACRLRREIVTGDSSLKDWDGDSFFEFMDSVYSKAHVVFPIEQAKLMLRSYRQNKKWDFVHFLPLYQLVELQTKGFSQLSCGVGTYALALARQINTERYALHRYRLKEGVLWGDFFLRRIHPRSDDATAKGKKPGLFLEYKIAGQAVRGLTCGGELANFDAVVLLSHPLNFGLSSTATPFYRSTRAARAVYSAFVSENGVTKRRVSTKVHEVVNTSDLTSAMYKTLAVQEVVNSDEDRFEAIKSLVEVCSSSVQTLLSSKGNKPALLQGLEDDTLLTQEISQFLIDPKSIPESVSVAKLTRCKKVRKGVSGFRHVAKQTGKSERFDIVLNRMMQQVLCEVNKEMGYVIHNYLPGMSTGSDYCAGHFQEQLKIHNAKKLDFGMFNLDFVSCFNNLNFSNPNIGKWIRKAEETFVRRMGSDALLTLIRPIVHSFIDRVNGTGYVSDRDLPKGKVETGLNLLPSVWVFLTLPLVEKLVEHRDAGNLTCISAVGDDFGAMTKANLSECVRSDIISIFDEFASDLGLTYHYWKNYQVGEKADTSPEKSGLWRPKSDSPWVSVWPKHLDIVHGAMWLRRDGQLAPYIAAYDPGTISSKESSAAIYYAQMKAGLYFVPTIHYNLTQCTVDDTLEGASGVPGSHESGIQVDNSKVRGELMRKLWSPGKQTHIGHLHMFIENRHLKWWRQTPGRQEIPNQDSEAVSQSQSINFTKKLAIELSEIRNSKKPFVAKKTLANHHISKSISIFHSNPISPCKRIGRITSSEIREFLSDDAMLLLEFLVKNRLVKHPLTPAHLKDFETGFITQDLRCGLTHSHSKTMIPAALIHTEGGTSTEFIPRIPYLNKELMEGHALVPELRIFWNDEAKAFVGSHGRRSKLTDLGSFFGKIFELVFSVEEQAIMLEQSGISAFKDGSKTTGRNVLNREQAKNRAFAYFRNRQWSSVLAECDPSSLKEVMRKLGRFRSYVKSDKNNDLKAFLEDLRNQRTQSRYTTEDAWEIQLANVSETLNLFTRFQEDLSDRLQTVA